MHKRVETPDISVEKPNVGKATATHMLQKITLYERNTMSRKHRGNDLLSSSLATRGGYNEEATTSLSLSHSLTLCYTLCTTLFTIIKNY